MRFLLIFILITLINSQAIHSSDPIEEVGSISTSRGRVLGNYTFAVRRYVPKEPEQSLPLETFINHTPENIYDLFDFLLETEDETNYKESDSYESEPNYSAELPSYTYSEPEQVYNPMPIIESIVESVDWSVAQQLFPRNSDATVIDIVTGESFRVRRTFGSNHADVEPLTIQDSQIIYNIWGSNSWAQRAVVVITQTGDVLAGSMNGYPHAGLDRYPPLAIIDNRSGGFGRGQNLNAIQGNGVDGHFCIHFAGSTTHGSARVHKGHQAMVQAAADFIASNF